MKISNRITAVLFSVIIFGLFALCIFLPREDYSASERRKLASFPEFSAENIINGRFMAKFEEYAPDNFPFRDAFRSLKAVVSLNVFGRSDNNGIYEHNGYITEADYPLGRDSVKRAADIFRKINEKYIANKNANVYFSVIPDKNYFLAQDAGALSYDYAEMLSLIRSETDYMKYIDIIPLLEIEDYYKTDTHWRQEKITDVAHHLAKEMGVDVNAEYEENQLDAPFYGVYYGQYAMPGKGETLYYLTNPVFDSCVVTDHENGRQISVYDMKKAAGNDPYEIFLSGPLSLVTVENPNAKSEKELVIFRDSFACALAPLLAQGYSKITLVDIRYIHSDMVCRMVDFENADVLFIYSTMVLNNSETFK